MDQATFAEHRAMQKLHAEHLRGDVVMTRHYGADGRSSFTIDHADPRTTMTGRLAFEMLGRDAVMGDIIRITGANREVVYRITGQDFVRDLWLLEWPD